MKRTLYICLSLAALLSCTKQQETEPAVASMAGEPITFNIQDQVAVKSSVETLTDLVYNSTSNPNAHVYIWATKEGSDLKKEVTPATTPPTYVYDYTNKEIFYNSTFGTWDISGTGNKASWECKEDTTTTPHTYSGYTYNFSAYAIRGTEVSAVTNTTSSNFGKSFTVKLPKTYSKNCGTDFLLSNITPVVTTWNGSAARGNIVNFHMEHALASIRVKVVANADIHKIGIQGIQIKNFYSDATMQCTNQATYGSGKTNKWTMTLPSNNTTDYILGDVTRGDTNSRNTINKCTGEGMIINKTDVRERVIMDFIAVPQDPSNAVLTIAYLVQELDGASEHQVVSSWELKNYSSWEYGYRNVYTITIDTSNSLYATIDDWDTGNSVTGVVLP